VNGAGGPLSEDDERWEEEATDARHQALDNVRATAKEWGTSIGLILGAFTTAAFLKGPEALKDVPGAGFKLTAFGIITYEPAPIVLLSVLGGALVLAFALAAAAFAAQGTPGWSEQLTGQVYAVKSMEATKASIGWLLTSRLATAAAAALILLGMAVAWTADLNRPTTDQTTSAIVGAGAVAICGVLATGPDGAVSVTPKGSAPRDVDPTASVTIVESCP
jgi:hypothetical protein